MMCVCLFLLILVLCLMMIMLLLVVLLYMRGCLGGRLGKFFVGGCIKMMVLFVMVWMGLWVLFVFGVVRWILLCYLRLKLIGKVFWFGVLLFMVKFSYLFLVCWFVCVGRKGGLISMMFLLKKKLLWVGIVFG